jgi:acetyl esterase
VQIAGLHPQVAQLLDLYTAAGFPRLSEGTVAGARERAARIRQVVGDGPAIPGQRDLALPGPDGPIPARRYLPESPRSGRIVWYHGGGFVTGVLDDHDPICRALAKATGLQLVSVAYRHAPEHPFPSGVSDAYAALQAIAAEAGGAPIVVGGDSSGGNFAAVVAQIARDRGGPAVALQVLVYPVTDCDFDTDSYLAYADIGLPVGRAEMQWFWDLYLADPGRRTDPLASPLRAAELAGLPPALVVLSGRDVLLDEGLGYAERLADAGVPVETLRYDDVLHGFFTMAGYLDRSDEAIAWVAEAIARGLD